MNGTGHNVLHSSGYQGFGVNKKPKASSSNLTSGSGSSLFHSPISSSLKVFQRNSMMGGYVKSSKVPRSRYERDSQGVEDEDENVFLLNSEDNYDEDEISDIYDVRNGTEVHFELKERKPRSVNNRFAKNVYDPKHTSSHVYTDNPRPENIDYIDVTIKPNDTLQSIALSFNCQLFDLKRINNIISEQDFYGKTTLKVPVKKHGIHSERYHQRSKSAESFNGFNPSLRLNSVSSDPCMDKLINGHRSSSQSDLITDPKEYIAALDQNVKQVVEAAGKKLSSQDAIELLIPHSHRTGTVHYVSPGSLKASSAYSFDGADCGMSLWHVLILVVLICVLVPVIYIVLVEDPQLLSNATEVGHHHGHR